VDPFTSQLPQELRDDKDALLAAGGKQFLAHTKKNVFSLCLEKMEK
jgi:hypothetical protein